MFFSCFSPLAKVAWALSRKLVKEFGEIEPLNGSPE